MRTSPLAALAAAFMFTLVSAGAAYAADPVAWDTNSGSCSGYGSAGSHTQQVGHAGGVARISTGSGATAKTFWSTFYDVSVGSYASVYLYCPDPFNWQASFYDTPTTPTNFAGVGANSELPVQIPRAGQYVADVTVNQGAVKFEGTTLASTGRVDLGTIRAGTSTFRIAQLEGPATSWTARISALPVVLSAVKTDSTYASSGDIVTVSYTVSGDTNVTAVVTDAMGRPVRTLASGLAAAMGDRSLTWDARGDGGAALTDGAYTITVTSTDAYGATSSGSAQVTVDNVAPVAVLASPQTILPTQAAVVTVTDAASGVGQIRYSTDSTGAPDPDPFGYSDDAPAGPVTLTVKAPYDGWDAGRHVLRVYSRDKAGNSTHADLAFTASLSAGKPPAATKPTSTAGSGITWTSCGSISSKHVFKLRTAKGPSCATAKTVARKASGRRKARVLGYACSRTTTTYTCRSSGKTIRWNRQRA